MDRLQAVTDFTKLQTHICMSSAMKNLAHIFAGTKQSKMPILLTAVSKACYLLCRLIACQVIQQTALQGRSMNSWCKAVLCIVAVAAVVAIIVGLLVGGHTHSSSSSSNANVDPATVVSISHPAA